MKKELLNVTGLILTKLFSSERPAFAALIVLLISIYMEKIKIEMPQMGEKAKLFKSEILQMSKNLRPGVSSLARVTRA